MSGKRKGSALDRKDAPKETKGNAKRRSLFDKVVHPPPAAAAREPPQLEVAALAADEAPAETKRSAHPPCRANREAWPEGKGTVHQYVYEVRSLVHHLGMTSKMDSGV